jgi:hypothetical protein
MQNQKKKVHANMLLTLQQKVLGKKTKQAPASVVLAMHHCVRYEARNVELHIAALLHIGNMCH